MNMKVAKLIEVSLITRVIVDEDATDEEMLDTAREQIVEKAKYELYENITLIMDDEENPYDPETDDEV